VVKLVDALDSKLNLPFKFPEITCLLEDHAESVLKIVLNIIRTNIL